MGVKLWADQYLRSDKFRHFVNGKLSKTLKADTELAPFQYQGLTVFSDHLKAHGDLRAPFAQLQMDHIRAEFSTRRVWEGVWQIEQLEVAKLDVALDGHQGSRSAGSQTRQTGRQVEGARQMDALVDPKPRRDRNGNDQGCQPALEGWTTDRDRNPIATERWRVGDRRDWRYGRARRAPEADPGQATAPVSPTLRLCAERGIAGRLGRSLNVTGEVEMNKRLDLQAKVTRLPIGPLLPEDWRARLRGNLSGDINILSPLPAQGSPTLSGTVHLTEASLEALPVLDQIAIFTRTAQFRRLALTRATGEFQRNDERLTVQNFVAESAGLIRLEGAFRVEGKRIDGNFEVGVTPSSLQWLPGSQARVFTVARDGYLWAPMRLAGPLEKELKTSPPV